MSAPLDPAWIAVPDGARLSMSPQAKRPEFEVQGNGLRLAPSFSTRDLRFEVDGKATAMVRTEHGYRYQAHWPAFTALMDARADLGAACVAARQLAHAPVDRAAPEIGFPHRPAFTLLDRLTLRSEFKARPTASLAWNTDQPFLAYWRALGAPRRRALLKTDGAQLLEVALLTQRFLVADTLWQAGARLGEAELASGRALFGLTEGSLGATPSLAMHVAMHRAHKPHRDALITNLSDDERALFSPWLDKLDKDDNLTSAVAAHIHRWLGRLVEQGINANGTLPFQIHFVDEDRTVDFSQRAFPLFLSALHTSDWHGAWSGKSEFMLTGLMAERWSTSMQALGFDPLQPIPGGPNGQETSLEEWLTMYHLRELLPPWNALILARQLPPGMVHRKTRL